MKNIHVAIDWCRLKWQPGDTWNKVVLPRLKKTKIEESKLHKSVYVIRLNGEYAIDYPKKESPVLYIGEGNFNSRLSKHKGWISELKTLVGDFSFEICIATPRVRKSEYAYRDCEAALLDRFGNVYGSAPLWNKQYETRTCPHYEYSAKKMDEALGKRSGSRYLWAVKPMRSSAFYANFIKTHRR
jgi:hypothetical protein